MTCSFQAALGLGSVTTKDWCAMVWPGRHLGPQHPECGDWTEAKAPRTHHPRAEGPRPRGSTVLREETT